MRHIANIRSSLFCTCGLLIAACSSGPGTDKSSAPQIDDQRLALNAAHATDTLTVQTPASSAPSAPKHVPDGYVHVPGGWLTHSSCTHQIPNRSHVKSDLTVVDDHDTPLDHFERCNYPVYRTGRERPKGGARPQVPNTSGWVASTAQFIPPWSTTWTYISATVTVPGTPNDTSATIFYFNGLGPSNQTQILQPVLQWGVSAAGGGPSWALATWEVFPGGVAAFTPLEPVSSGDSILFQAGLVAYTSNGSTNEETDAGQANASGPTYEYLLAATDQTTNAQASGFFMNVAQGADAPPNGSLFPWAYPAVYESYGDVGCESGIDFTNINVCSNSALDITGKNCLPYTGTTGPGGAGNSWCNDQATGDGSGDGTTIN